MFPGWTWTGTTGRWAHWSMGIVFFMITVRFTFGWTGTWAWTGSRTWAGTWAWSAGGTGDWTGTRAWAGTRTWAWAWAKVGDFFCRIFSHRN
jgi:hypothetical protein